MCSSSLKVHTGPEEHRRKPTTTPTGLRTKPAFPSLTADPKAKPVELVSAGGCKSLRSEPKRQLVGVLTFTSQGGALSNGRTGRLASRLIPWQRRTVASLTKNKLINHKWCFLPFAHTFPQTVKTGSAGEMLPLWKTAQGGSERVNNPPHTIAFRLLV